MGTRADRQIQEQVLIRRFEQSRRRPGVISHGVTGYADKSGRHEKQPGLTLPKVD